MQDTFRTAQSSILQAIGNTPIVPLQRIVVGALQLARELGAGHTVATVAVDTGLKYLAGDLYEV